MRLSLRNLRQRYNYALILLREMVITDYKLRYQGSVLGYLWSLLKPLALFAILYVVFVRFLKIGAGIPHYPIYLLLGIVFWNYFVEVTVLGMQSIVNRGDMLRKINFPKYVVVLSASFSALINLFFNLIVVLIFMYFTHVPITRRIFFFPLAAGELFLLALALAFYLSAVYVKYRDFSHIWEVVMQGAFYATPILYPLNSIPHRYAKVLILSPMAQLIQDARYSLVTPDTLTITRVYGSSYYRIIPVAIVLVLIAVAASYFRKKSKYFAEDI